MITIKRNKPLHISLWIAQIILACMFIMAGIMKSTVPADELIKQMPWVADVGVWFVRFIGMSELLGGIGLILPSLLRIKPILTPYAAFGIATIMLLAIGYHGMKGEYQAILINLVIAGIAIFIYSGRKNKEPIVAR